MAATALRFFTVGRVDLPKLPQPVEQRLLESGRLRPALPDPAAPQPTTKKKKRKRTTESDEPPTHVRVFLLGFD